MEGPVAGLISWVFCKSYAVEVAATSCSWQCFTLELSVRCGLNSSFERSLLKRNVNLRLFGDHDCKSL